MSEPASEETCRQACRDLVADRCGMVIGPDALAFRHMAREEGLSGLAAVAVEAGRLVVPHATRERIRRDWSRTLHHSLLLDAECTRIGRLAQKTIVSGAPLSPPVLLKGPAVARRYGNPSVRTYVDLDFIVPTSEVRSWAAFLGKAGYWAPEPDVAAVEQRLREGVEFTSGNGFSVDLHASIFVERRARRIDYSRLVDHIEPSPFAGVLQLRQYAQLLVLALHLAHHGASDHRLIWYRDFVELGDATGVRAARNLAEQHDLAWALETALVGVEEVLGRPEWNARPSPVPPFGLASVHRLGCPEYLRHVAVFRELGFGAGAHHLATRLDPRRFLSRDGRFDVTLALGWITSTALRVRRTPWLQAWKRQ